MRMRHFQHTIALANNTRSLLLPVLILSLLAALLLCVLVSPSLAARSERLIYSWKPLHYNVSITFDEKLTTITSAKTEITILTLKEGVSELDFDFGEMVMDSVMINGAAASYERSPGRLKVKLATTAAPNARLVITVTYHGKPVDGLILSPDKAGKASAIGDNWPNRLHHWIPCFDHPSAKATVTFTVTAPAREIVVANGKLERVSRASKTMRTWTWSEGTPIPPYCMIIAVGEFA